MKLNHANLCASDVASLSKIFADHFGFALLQAGQVPQGAKVAEAGTAFAMLRGSDGFSLVITQIDASSPQAYPNNFHVGFVVETPDEVRAKYAELSERGCSPNPIKSFEAMGATWTAFYCPVGDGIVIEVTHHT